MNLDSSLKWFWFQIVWDVSCIVVFTMFMIYDFLHNYTLIGSIQFGFVIFFIVILYYDIKNIIDIIDLKGGNKYGN